MLCHPSRTVSLPLCEDLSVVARRVESILDQDIGRYKYSYSTEENREQTAKRKKERLGRDRGNVEKG